jgi:hypothetical protein
MAALSGLPISFLGNLGVFFSEKSRQIAKPDKIT